MQYVTEIDVNGTGPGATAAAELLNSVSPEHADVIDRWGAGNRDFITGILAGLFLGEDWSMMVLSNAARAIADGEVTIKIRRA
ncbi:hypothetical protein [Croceicoccus naphthovorans]|uniref:Uncharacterized protein n=1 Tax=Croceicoccus naphthovorans TaxID=1348774 RepID=A0A0G3XFI0_9SPHN|nr:hypothetical protein [Croceicoccus naphthovorans]AKM09374.1 hypothetical protein AB433_04245 [Croceicoccus naphthovorans]MBB3990298.1 flagellar biosynthesis/type III secretory pathway ATPase [Croceicoccus naphthovorans]